MRVEYTRTRHYHQKEDFALDREEHTSTQNIQQNEMTNNLWVFHLMVVGLIANSRVVRANGFEGDLVIGRNDDDFHEKIEKVHKKIQKERNYIMWEKRKKLLEELRRDNISVELDSEKTKREIEGAPDNKVSNKGKSTSK